VSDTVPVEPVLRADTACLWISIMPCVCVCVMLLNMVSGALPAPIGYYIEPRQLWNCVGGLCPAGQHSVCCVLEATTRYLWSFRVSDTVPVEPVLRADTACLWISIMPCVCVCVTLLNMVSGALPAPIGQATMELCGWLMPCWTTQCVLF